MTSEVEIGILRRMDAGRKLEIMQVLWKQAWTLKAVGVRMQYPDLTETEVTERVRQIFLNARA